MVSVHRLCGYHKEDCQSSKEIGMVIWQLWVRCSNFVLAATGHIYHAKSTRLYLQLKIHLEKELPWLHQQFQEKGFHCIRRTDKFCLAIEQTMMCSFKNLEDLTRGRGMDESTQNIWISTLPCY